MRRAQRADVLKAIAIRSDDDRSETPNTEKRKLAGTVALLALIAVYALLAMLVAVVLQVRASKVVELLYYIVGGPGLGAGRRRC